MRIFDTLQFMNFLAKLSINLSSLLDERFIPHENEGSMVGRKLHELMTLYKQQRYEELERSCTLLKNLNDELELIKKKDPSLLKKFVVLHKTSRKKRSKKFSLTEYTQNSEARYFGFRAEVHVAAQLIKNNIEFIKKEPPDFEIQNKNSKSKLECTSTHLHPLSTNKQILDKIPQAIKEKLHYPFVDNRTAIVCDITNLMFYCEINNTLPEESTLREIVSKEIFDSELGAVVLFFYLFDKDKNMIFSKYITIPNLNIDPGFRSLLKSVFLEGENPVTSYTMPRIP